MAIIFRAKFPFLLLAFLICTAGCISIVPGDGPDPAAHPFGAKQKNKQIMAFNKKLVEWKSLGAAINPLLREYYFANESKCKFPQNDNEVEMDGFADYAAQHGIHLKQGRIVDPWGDPVHFVIAHKGDRALRACGKSYGIADQNPNIIAVGLLLKNPSNVPSGSGREWALQNGYIPIYPRTIN